MQIKRKSFRKENSKIKGHKIQRYLNVHTSWKMKKGKLK